MRIPLTEFAPAERAPIEVIHQQSSALAATELVAELLNSVGQMVFIVNQQRQIVFASQHALDFLPGKSAQDIFGQRPGEVLGCAHAQTGPNGCGTDQHCRQCGAAKAIIESLAGKRNVQELRMTRVLNFNPQALDLLVCASPFPHKGETFSILSVVDNSHEKRRRVLERSLFDEVNPSANALARQVAMLRTRAPANLGKDLRRLESGLRQVLDQIHSQHDLAAAESGKLVFQPVSFQAREWLRQFLERYIDRSPARRQRLRLNLPKSSALLVTDPTLLNQVLGYLVDNAFEVASVPKVVTVGCRKIGPHVQFSVHNPGVMPRPVQLQVFQRSFTTKGQGRGLGTYLVRLLVEQYLGGTADFKTGSKSGTTFLVTLPLEPASGREQE
jgi:signal transduction histidine kinase